MEHQLGLYSSFGLNSCSTFLYELSIESRLLLRISFINSRHILFSLSTEKYKEIVFRSFFHYEIIYSIDYYSRYYWTILRNKESSFHCGVLPAWNISTNLLPFYYQPAGYFFITDGNQLSRYVMLYSAGRAEHRWVSFKMDFTSIWYIFSY